MMSEEVAKDDAHCGHEECRGVDLELQHKVDRYGGVVMSLDDCDQLQCKLRFSLTKWKEMGRRGVWVKCVTQQSHHIVTLTQFGFDFHHAHNGYVMLTKWLPEGPSRLPGPPSAYLGAGGFVMDSSGRVLVIVERHRDKEESLKIPGGHVDEGESFGEAAVREVWEECGVRTRFEHLMCVRHLPHCLFGTADVYAVCRLSLVDEANCEIRIDEREIQKAQWMSLEEYVAHDNVSPLHREIATVALSHEQQRRCGNNIGVWNAHEVQSFFFGDDFYFPTQKANQTHDVFSSLPHERQ